jgi:hypothetical protein
MTIDLKIKLSSLKLKKLIQLNVNNTTLKIAIFLNILYLILLLMFILMIQMIVKSSSHLARALFLLETVKT